MNRCIFENIKSENAISIIRSKYHIEKVNIEKAENNGVKIKYSKGMIESSHIMDAKKHGLIIVGAALRIRGSNIKNIGKTGINATDHSEVEILETKIEQCNKGIESRNGAVVNFKNSEILKCQKGIYAHEETKEIKSGNANMLNNKIINNMNIYPKKLR